MAHPKRRHSSTRRDKRRTHDALTTKQLSVDSATGETHQAHRAHVFATANKSCCGFLYYSKSTANFTALSHSNITALNENCSRRHGR